MRPAKWQQRRFAARNEKGVSSPHLTASRVRSSCSWLLGLGNESEPLRIAKNRSIESRAPHRRFSVATPPRAVCGELLRLPRATAADLQRSAGSPLDQLPLWWAVRGIVLLARGADRSAV